jgi:hypothetical protein
VSSPRGPVEAIALGRFAFAAMCIFSPPTAARSILGRASDMNSTATSFAALTGTRAAALGAIGMASSKMEQDQRSKALLLLACVDSVDGVAGVVRERRNGRPGVAAFNGLFAVVLAVLQLRAALPPRY